jgi:hypothetical protein
LTQAKEAQRVRDLSKERDVLDVLNSQMRANQAALKQRAADDATAATAKLAKSEAEVRDLKEQVATCVPHRRHAISAGCCRSGDGCCSHMQWLLNGTAGFKAHVMLSMQVHDLMMFIEGQRQLAGAGPDVQQGSISIPSPLPQPTPQPGSRSTRRAAKSQ